MAITAITAIPNNDHKIYFDKDKGFVFERTATIFAYDDETKKTIALYAEKISNKGEEDVFTDELDGYDDYVFELLGTRGDSVTPRDIRTYLYYECEDGNEGIYDALYNIHDRYLHIDNTKAEDVVRIDIEYCKGYTDIPSFYFTINSDWFTGTEEFGTFVHLEDINDCENIKLVDDEIIKPLADYALWLERPTINIKLCPEWYTNPDIPEEECDKINEKLYKIYAEYIPKLTDYIEAGIGNIVREYHNREAEIDARAEKKKMLKDKYNEMYKF